MASPCMHTLHPVDWRAICTATAAEAGFDVTNHDSPAPTPVDSEVWPAPPGRRRALVVVVAGTLLTLAAGGLLLFCQQHAVNRSALSASPRPVTVVEARAAMYQSSRSYVGAVDSWVEADVGPQYISAYVQTVLVRPGAPVSRGQVLATLDCASPGATTRAVAMQASAIDARQRALADEAARVTTLLDGGFVALNDVEQKAAQSKASQSELLSTQARLAAESLNVRDCVLRAPFDGEIAIRHVDPGAFVHPGAAIVSVVDRSTVRVTVDAPEKDFEVVSPATVVRIRMLATGAEVGAPISRRAPKADPRTRTIHFEVDVPDPRRQYPVGTTAIVEVSAGEPVPATEIPVYAATEREQMATLFVVAAGIAHKRDVRVLGERGGSLFVDPGLLPAHTLVVIEGRAQLSDGDRVEARVQGATEKTPPADGGARGGGYGGPL